MCWQTITDKCDICAGDHHGTTPEWKLQKLNKYMQAPVFYTGTTVNLVMQDKILSGQLLPTAHVVLVNYLTSWIACETPPAAKLFMPQILATINIIVDL